MFLDWLAHRRSCSEKQKERQHRIDSLPAIYHEPLTEQDNAILNQYASEIATKVKNGELDPVDVVRAYGKKALRAQEATNCLTEILLPEAEEWAATCNHSGPLAGMPVSLKDTVSVAGFDSCIGYSAWVGKPATKDSPLVRLLRDAGAVPFVKTNIPITLLSLESSNEVFGTATNPHNKDYTPGGSSGGEGALLAYGGSRLGIGTDVAGSVRGPSHFSGTYTIKASSERFPKAGNATSIPGQTGVPAVYSPMTRTLEDLETMWRAIFSMKPWTYDYSCLVLPWRDVDLSAKPVRWGVMWDDGIIKPSPACRRALEDTVAALKAAGHEIVTLDPPKPLDAITVGAQLIYADAAKTVTNPIRSGEWNDPGVADAVRALRVPWALRKIWVWYWRYIRRDALYADLIEVFHEKTVEEYFALVSRREKVRERWWTMWNEQEIDFILTVPNPLPASPHRGWLDGWKACTYTFLFNILDYSAGVLPVTHVDRATDRLDGFKPRNHIEERMMAMYDADKMHGLPVGVQIVGKRLEEEKVLEGMKIAEKCLKDAGKGYTLLQVD
ncbi:amidase signature enzyme [Trametopsis cervina]|nr:amidase signature enzyme [Trametopsis cervina]